MVSILLWKGKNFIATHLQSVWPDVAIRSRPIWSICLQYKALKRIYPSLCRLTDAKRNCLAIDYLQHHIEAEKTICLLLERSLECFLSYQGSQIRSFFALSYTKINCLLWMISGQSYKSSMIVIYYSRVVPDLKIPHIRL